MVAFKKPVALLGLASLVTALPTAPASPRSVIADDLVETPQEEGRYHILPVSTHRAAEKRGAEDAEEGKRTFIPGVPGAGLDGNFPTNDLGIVPVETLNKRSPVDMDALKRSIIYWLPKAGLVDALPTEDLGLDSVQTRGTSEEEESKRSIIYWLPKAGLVSALPVDDLAATEKRDSGDDDVEEAKRSIIYWLPKAGLVDALPVNDDNLNIGATKRSDVRAAHVERAVEDLFARSEPDTKVRNNIKRNFYAWLHFGNAKLVADPAQVDDTTTPVTA